MKRTILVLAFCALAALGLVSCKQEQTYTCDLYRYEFNGAMYVWNFKGTEDWKGTSASDAQQNCNDYYGGSWSCRDCQ